MAQTSLSQSQLSARLVRYDELTPSEVEQWRGLCDQRHDYQSALLRPEFASIMSSIRDDVRIALFERDDLLQGVLAVHLRPDGLARPLGAPFADYSGPVLSVEVNAPLDDLIQLAGIPAFSSTSVVEAEPVVSMQTPERCPSSHITESHLIRPGDLSPEDFLESRRAAHAKRFKNFRRLANQIERDAGKMKLEWGPVSGSTLTEIFDLKSKQYRDSGLVDLTATTASRQVLDAVAASPYNFAIILRCGERLISAHFGIKIGSEYHPWIAVFDPAYSAYSPGNLLLMKALISLPEMGISTYDLANGHDHYKKYFANATRPTRSVFVTGSGMRAARHQLSDTVWRWLGANKEDAAAGRLQRRLAQIATSEFGPISRIREFGYAILARSILKRRT